MQVILDPAQDGNGSSPPVDLVSLLRNYVAEQGNSDGHLQNPAKPDRKNKNATFLRAPLVIRAAAACMEKKISARSVTATFSTSGVRPTAAPLQSKWPISQTQIYAEKRRIEELEKDRQATFEDLVHIPWVGEFYDTIDS